jgi:hypothetical protein
MLLLASMVATAIINMAFAARICWALGHPYFQQPAQPCNI